MCRLPNNPVQDAIISAAKNPVSTSQPNVSSSRKGLRGYSQEYNQREGQPVILTCPLYFRQPPSPSRRQEEKQLPGQQSHGHLCRETLPTAHESVSLDCQSLRGDISSELRTQKKQKARERNGERKFTPSPQTEFQTTTTKQEPAQEKQEENLLL